MSMIKRSMKVSGAIAGVAATAVLGFQLAMQTPAVADDHAMASSPDAAITYRKNVMSIVGANAQAMGAIAKGDVNNEDAFADHADMLAIAADLTVAAFEQDTHGKGNEKTTAKQEVWSDWDTFRKGLNKMAEDAITVADYAANGDMDLAKSSLGDLLKNCKACHDDFRTR